MANFKTFELAVGFYRACKPLKMNGNLRNQLSRASSSIVLNLAEGNGKLSLNEKRRFYEIALGSLRECQAVLIISNHEDPTLIDQADHLGASLYKLIRALK